MNLPELGWTERERQLFEPYRSRGPAARRASRSPTGPRSACTSRTTRRWLTCRGGCGTRRNHAVTCRRWATGSAVQWPSRQERATIQHILPRTSLFSRKVPGQETTEQILAANVNVAFLVAGLDRDFSIRRLERYLAMTWESGARPVIVLNKADLADDLETCRAEVAGIAGAVPVHTISSKLGSGIEELFPYLQLGTTVALLGSSGVGKSTLINRLVGHERQLTRDVREKDSRGRHTTTHRELVPLAGRRAADRHARDARAAVVECGRGREGGLRRRRGSRRRAATSETVRTTPSRSAP